MTYQGKDLKSYKGASKKKKISKSAPLVSSMARLARMYSRDPVFVMSFVHGYYYGYLGEEAMAKIRTEHGLSHDHPMYGTDEPEDRESFEAGKKAGMQTRSKRDSTGVAMQGTKAEKDYIDGAKSPVANRNLLEIGQ